MLSSRLRLGAVRASLTRATALRATSRVTLAALRPSTTATAATAVRSLRTISAAVTSATKHVKPVLAKRLAVWVPVRRNSSFTSSPVGTAETMEYRVAFRSSASGKAASPWHDIPLFPECTSEERGIVNYVNEIPRHTKAKMEIATAEVNTPIKQDIKKGKLRYFTYGTSGIPFNYGALPQTWEDPTFKDPLTGFGGDNDPLDVVELSETPLPVGSVMAVKVLGIMALIDEGETDWKVIAIALTHPLAPKLWDISDVDKHMPHAVTAIREWFKNYKTTDGKPVNSFGLNEQAADRAEAMRVVRETHHSWRDLITGKIKPGKLWLPANPQLTASPAPPKSA